MKKTRTKQLYSVKDSGYAHIHIDVDSLDSDRGRRNQNQKIEVEQLNDNISNYGKTLTIQSIRETEPPEGVNQ